MNLIKLDYNEVSNLKNKVGNIEDFKITHKTGPASRLDLFKDIDSDNKDLYVANKDGSSPEFTGETLYN